MAVLSFAPMRSPQSAILLAGAGRREPCESRQSSGLHTCIQGRPERRGHERFCVEATRARIPFRRRVQTGAPATFLGPTNDRRVHLSEHGRGGRTAIGIQPCDPALGGERRATTPCCSKTPTASVWRCASCRGLACWRTARHSIPPLATFDSIIEFYT